MGGRPVWLHKNENFFLYYSSLSSMWGVGEVLGGEEALLENRGEVGGCPGELKGGWRRRGEDGEQEEEERLEVVCLRGPCAGYHCGPNAECEERSQTCQCRGGHTGDPYHRCFPTVGRSG